MVMPEPRHFDHGFPRRPRRLWPTAVSRRASARGALRFRSGGAEAVGRGRPLQPPRSSDSEASDRRPRIRAGAAPPDRRYGNPLRVSMLTTGCTSQPVRARGAKPPQTRRADCAQTRRGCHKWWQPRACGLMAGIQVYRVRGRRSSGSRLQSQYAAFGRLEPQQ